MSGKRGRSFTILVSLFLLSGISGLVYQLTWMRLLGLVCGVSHVAMTLIVAVFMAGLGLGYAIGMRFSKKGNRVVRMYALLELVIGLYGFASPSLMQWLDLAVNNLLPADPTGSQTLFSTMIIITVGICIFLVPTVAMGMTLPLVAQAGASMTGGAGKSVALLYGINTLGAVIGVAAGGLVLLPLLGIRLSIFLAASINIFVATAAYLFVSESDEGTAVAGEAGGIETPRAAVPSVQEADLGWRRRFLLPAYGLCGFISLSCELAWTRGLIVSFGSSVYAFTIVLATFLAGIGVGSILYRRLVRRGEPTFLWFGILELLIGVSIIFSIVIIGVLPYLFLMLFSITGGTFILLLAGELLLAALIIAVPTLAMGILFPLVLHLAGSHLENAGRVVGRFGAVNTIGSVCGVMLTGFFLIPWLGADQTLRFMGLLAIVLGTVYVFELAMREHDRRKMVQHAVFLILLLLLVVIAPGWRPDTVSQGVFQYAPFYENNRLPKLDVLYFKDGWSAQVAVTSQLDRISLRINGKVDGSDGADMQTQTLLAALPMMMAPSAENVFILGLGTGVTLGKVLEYPVKHVVCSEIEERVLEAASFFRHVNGTALEDPRAVISLSDARSFLRRTNTRFEVIINEPSNPWIRGIANLFTIEFFTLCRERLTDEGIICQWLHLYGMSRQDMECAIRSFLTVFPDTLFWRGSEGDMLMLGFKGPMVIDNQLFQQRFVEHEATFEAIGVHTPHQLLTGFVARGASVHDLVADAPLNIDDLPLLEFTTPLHLHHQHNKDHIRDLFTAVPTDLPPIVGDGSAEILDDVRYSRAMSCLDEDLPGMARKLLRESFRTNPEKPLNTLNLVILLLQSDDFVQAEQVLKDSRAPRDDPFILWGHTLISVKSGQLDRAEMQAREILRSYPAFNQASDLLKQLERTP